MSLNTIALPVPNNVATAGTSIDTSLMDVEKTLQCQAGSASIISIQISNDNGTTWIDLHTFAGSDIVTLDAFAQLMRVNVANVDFSTAPVVNVSANANSSPLVTASITVPMSDVSSTPVDTDTMSDVKTIYCSGSPNEVVSVETSNFDDTAWINIATLRAGKYQQVSHLTRKIRVTPISIDFRTPAIVTIASSVIGTNINTGSSSGVVAGTYTNTTLTVNDAGLITDAANGTASFNFTDVANVLGSEAGANTGYIFKSDGGGSGEMTKNVQSIPNIITVGTSGDVWYNGIAIAVAAAIDAGATDGNPFVINVNPGTYLEPPFSIPAGVVINGTVPDSVAGSVVSIIALDPNSDLITVSDLAFLNIPGLRNVLLRGVNDPTKALIKITGLCYLSNVVITGCSNGIWVAGISGGGLVADNVSIRAAFPGEDGYGGDAVDIGILLDIAGFTLNNINLETYPSEFLPALGWQRNPIQTGIKAINFAGGAIFTLDCSIGHIDDTQVAILVDSDARLEIGNMICVSNACSTRMGPNGSITALTIQAGIFDANDLDFDVQSSTGKIFVNATVDAIKIQTVPGGVVSGLLQEFNTGLSNFIGDTTVEYPSGRSASVPQFIHSLQQSGLRSGGVITSAGDLSATVAAGMGWIARDIPFDVEDISWPDTMLTGLVSSANNYIFVNSSTKLPDFSASVPSSDNIFLAVIVTGASTVRYIHTTQVIAENTVSKLQDYLLSTQKLVLKSGLAIVAGSTARRFSIDAGSYFRSIVQIDYAGTNDTTFSSFYGTNGATEIANVQNIDITSYDDDGTLEPMTDGYYRSDSVYLTSDGRVSVIYGFWEFATQQDAANQPITPPTSFISETGFPIAKVIVQKAVGIVEFVDQRIITAKAGSGSITVHAQLAGLSADDHLQYLLATGARAMGGDLNLGGFSITNVNLVKGVDTAAHAVRHQPGGADAIATATPIALAVGASSNQGSAASLARSDHQHALTSGTPQSIGVASSEGVSTSVTRLDHVHAHGSLAGGNTHTAVTTSVNGFMTAADKTKLDGFPASAVSTTTTLTAGTGLTGGGDLSTNRAFNVVANADGSITVNADDIQVGVLATDGQHGDRGGGSQHSNVVAAGASGFMTGSDKSKLDGLPSSAVPTSTTLTAGNGITGGGDLSANRTFAVSPDADGSISVGAGGVKVGVLATDAQHGNRGGGGLHTNVVASGAAGFMTGSDKAKLDGTPSSVPSTSRTLIAGAGLTGGGDLSADRTFNVIANVDGSIAVNLDDIQVGVLASDAQHGNRGGGAIHSIATGSVAGFLSAADKTKLDGLPSSAVATTRTLIAGAGLTGGGDLSADRTFNVIANADASIVVNADDIQVGTLGFSRVQTALSAATSSISVNSQKITNLATPTGPQDAVTKSYADSIATGISVKQAARVASTANINLSVGGLLTIDGVTVSDGDRVLAKDQTTGKENGIYNAHSGSWTRTTDADTSPEVTNGMFVFITSGTVNANTGWILTTPNPITLDTTSLTFAQFSSSESFVAGDGLVLTGSTFNVVANADGSIIANPNDIQVGILATDAQHGNRGGGALHSNVVAAGASGFMTGSDKTKLDGLPSSAVPTTTTLTAGAGLTGGGDLSTNRTFNVIANADASIVVNADDIQVGVLATDGQHGNRGGGALHSNVVAAGAAGFMTGSDKTKLDGLPSSVPASTRTLTAGAGLTGGGDLSADRTFNVIANADGSITVNADDIQVGILASDAQHGNRGGGGIHAAVTTSVNGFMSAADKTKLDGVASGATNLALTSSAPANVDKSAAVVGVGTTAARSDHKHDITTTVASAQVPGDAAIEGTATSLARSDHKHSLPAYGSTSATICQGNDSRLSDDRTASGIRTASTVVAVSSATAPTNGQVLTATSGTAATWQTPAGNTPATTIAEAAGSINTTSASDVLMTSMTLTPAAGTYLVWFSGDVSVGTSGNTVFTNIYSGGSKVAASDRTFVRGSQAVTASFNCMAKVTVNGAQAIEGRWRVTGGATATSLTRQLYIEAVA